MGSYVPNFIYRRKNTFAWAAATVGSIYMLGKWGLKQVEQATQKTMQQRMEVEDLSGRFRRMLTDCHFTVLSLLPQLYQNVSQEMDVGLLSSQLAQAPTKVPQKVEGNDRSTNGDTNKINGNHISEKTNGDVVTNRETNGTDSSLKDSTNDGDKTPRASSPQQELKTDESPIEIPRPKTRGELWKEITILSFSRTITSLYLIALLALQTHIQLNLLGRSSYVSHVVSSISSGSSDGSLTSDSESINESQKMSDLERAFGLGFKTDNYNEETIKTRQDLQRKYLTFSWWLLNVGWKSVIQKVREAVEEVIGPLSIRHTVVYGELGTLLSKIRERISVSQDGTTWSFLPALCPPTHADEMETLSKGGIPPNMLTISPDLRKLINETCDFLDSPDCHAVLTALLDQLFAQLVGNMEPAFNKNPQNNKPVDSSVTGMRFQDVTLSQASLATILPTLSNQTDVILNSNPNEYLDTIAEVQELREFSAVVYASYDKDNI